MREREPESTAWPPLEKPSPPEHHLGFVRPMYLYELEDYALDLVNDAKRRIKRSGPRKRMPPQDAAWERRKAAECMEMAAYCIRLYSYRSREDESGEGGGP